MQWRDLEITQQVRPLAVLEFRVEPADRPAGPPPLRVELAARYRMRLVAGERTLIWGRAARGYAGWWRLANDTPREDFAAPVRPIRADDVRRIEPEPRSRNWWLGWSRWYARELLASAHTPLARGLWHLRPATTLVDPTRKHDPYAMHEGTRWIQGTRETLARPALEWLFWQFGDEPLFALRNAPRPDAARVKAWRKHARAGTMPPLLAMGVTGFGSHVLLDGHDRLAACRAEGVEPPLLALDHVRREIDRGNAPWQRSAQEELARGEAAAAWWHPSRVRKENLRYVYAYGGMDHVGSRTLAYPLPGGRAAWDREVAQRLDALGPSASRAMLADEVVNPAYPT